MWSQRKPIRLLRYFLIALGVGLGVYSSVVVIGMLLGLWGYVEH
jgi:hypothetical protein